ncbi:MAG: VOC family protein [Vicinamibacterales bacterium]|jgi:glucose/arabinose dehydrogenase/catechol 2,3-dioxygenase-like lactoylglutathione lyase family enzyme|nr:cytochrome C [Acidobacteriota bacterium]MDP7338450.1 VOC family protein [Vicinamibacterales bacterium]MDP7480330.1 VOC family protein [Vicinamibacterales bacterium]MDP7671876.1 VOC family protein [Vicinamibacterales bacterium]HJO37717.1 VOC family protein [Vicinamibacterales bacterium]
MMTRLWLVGLLVGLLFGPNLGAAQESLPDEIRLDLEENGGLFVPDGFEAQAVINQFEGRVRHIAVGDNGDVYVKLRDAHEENGNAVLRDTNGDGRLDDIRYFGKYPIYGRYGTAMRIHDGYLYFSTQKTVYRQKLTPGQMVPDSEIEAIVVDPNEPPAREHNAKPIAFDDAGHLFVPFGAPSNSCQDPKRTPGQPGVDPCPQLGPYGGVWRFDADTPNQSQEDGTLFATGIRSLVGMDWNPVDRQLYTVMHGRDSLLRMFPNHFDGWESALLPAEEFLRVTEGADFGWPYCHYDQLQGKKVLAPEYGGDGQTVGRCSDYDLPIRGFPGHWAPNDIVFYHGDQFPDRYRNGAFVAFHGSTNRAPYPQSGYIIGFVPFANGEPSGPTEVFVDGFARVDPIVSAGDAVFRPMGIAIGPDGSMYVGETEHGAIWRIRFTGDAATFGENQLAAMKAREALSHIRTPDPVADNLSPAVLTGGALTYESYCATCHQADGEGDGARFPPIARTEWVSGDKNRLIDLTLNGMEGDIEVNGESYSNVMPQHSFLTDQELGELLTYLRAGFGNDASGVSEEEVRRRRNGASGTTLKIRLTSVFVDDQAEALGFYTEILGFQKKEDFPVGPFRWLTVVAPGAEDGPELLLEPSDNPAAQAFKQAMFEQGIAAAAFEVEDVQATYERLRESGVDFFTDPTSVGTATIAVFDDTGGNLIQIYETP